MLKIIRIVIPLVFLLSCSNQNKTVNLIKIEDTDTQAQIIEKSTLVVPTARQYEWQKNEFIAFIHFGPNTFTQREWGTGKEKPEIFNPTELDVNQWIETIKAAGMKMLMITAKHHDGFCLWPTSTTPHSVKNSLWKNGKGDVIEELTIAARKNGIKVGLYLSPADLNQIEASYGTYGNGSKSVLTKIPSNPDLQKKAKTVFEYKLDDYNRLFMNQLYELLTQYGEISEVWFDGANPKPGTGQTYNSKAWYDMIRKLQPNAVIAIAGPDVRWCGNEAGHTRKVEWSVIPFTEEENDFIKPNATDEDLGSRSKLYEADYLKWYPAETNTSIRNGWFYRDSLQHVKTVQTLLDTWYRSVGGNTVFLLNLTPDRRGLIPDKDANNLRELGKIIQISFNVNLMDNADVKASNSAKKHQVKYAIDKNENTCWKTADGIEEANIVISLKKTEPFNRLVLQEDILHYGQRIEEFAFDVWKNNRWQQVTSGTVVGYKNIRRFPTVSASKVRIRILKSRIAPTLSHIGLHNAPVFISNPVITRDINGMVSIKCQTPDPIIYYTVDGTTPDNHSKIYEKSFPLPKGGVVKAIAYVDNQRKSSDVVEKRFYWCQKKWSVLPADNQDRENLMSAIDNNENTVYTSDKNNTSIVISLGENVNISGFYYLPRQDKSLQGITKSYAVAISNDGKHWETIKTGDFSNIKNNPIVQEIRFGKSVETSWVKFTSLANVNNNECFSVAEIGVIM